MGVDYMVHPVDESMLQYGRQQGAALPSFVAEGHFPTAEELLQILKSTPGHFISIQIIRPMGDVEIVIESKAQQPLQPIPPFTATTCPQTYLRVTGNLCKSATQHWLSFHGDYDLMIKVIRDLSGMCGPQLFFECGDGLPWYILSPDAQLLGPGVEDSGK